jgi:hypothetical protein
MRPGTWALKADATFLCRFREFCVDRSGERQMPGEPDMVQRRARSVLAVILFACASAAFAQTRGITAEDYFAFESLSDPRFSPDGSTIAFVVTT